MSHHLSRIKVPKQVVINEIKLVEKDSKIMLTSFMGTKEAASFWNVAFIASSDVDYQTQHASKTMYNVH